MQLVLNSTFYMFFLSMVFLPRLNGQFRYEDLLMPILLAILLYQLKKIRHEEKTILAIWVIYLSYTTIVTWVNIIFHDLDILAILVAGKEVQYFLLFMLCMSYFKSVNNRKVFRKLLLIVFAVTFVFVSFYFFSYERSDYGLPYLNDHTPTNSMLVYFHFFVLALLMYSEVKSEKIFLYFALGMLPFVIFVGNRTGQMGLLIFFLIYFFLKLPSSARISFLVMTISVFLSSIHFRHEIYELLYYNNFTHPIFSASISRLATLFTLGETFISSRMPSIISILSLANENNFLIGCGRGCTHSVPGRPFDLGLGGDNQYAVNFAEIGIVGLLIHSLLFVSPFLLSSARKNKIFVAYSSAFLMMAMTGENFQLPRGAQFYWIISAFVLTQKSVIARIQDWHPQAIRPS